MDRYELENAKNIVDGYYRPPSPSDHVKMTVEEKFENAKKIALEHITKRMKGVEGLTLEQFLPKYRKDS